MKRKKIVVFITAIFGVIVISSFICKHRYENQESFDGGDYITFTIWSISNTQKAQIMNDLSKYSRQSGCSWSPQAYSSGIFPLAFTSFRIESYEGNVNEDAEKVVANVLSEYSARTEFSIKQ